MNIADLDEAEGLTAEIARGYLERTGWTKATLEDVDPSRWTKSEHTIWMPLESVDLAVTMQGLARVEHRSSQAILREMNPRMKKGLPSYDEQRAHSRTGGIWIATHGELGHGGSICFVSFHRDDGIEHDLPFVIWDGEEWREPDWLAAEVEDWSFWPCDAHGNKVRWPKVQP